MPAALGRPESPLEAGPQGFLSGGSRKGASGLEDEGGDSVNTESRAGHKTQAGHVLLAAGKQPGGALLNITVPNFWPLIPLLRPQGGPRRDQPLSRVQTIELGQMTTGEPRHLGE